MKTALVYDRINKWGGAERDLLVLHEIFPTAPLFTSLYDAKKAPWAKIFPEVIPSFLQKIPLLPKKHEYLGTLMPFAFESFDFSDFDLVISLTSEAAKGILTKPETKHICICLTPTRYLWSGYTEYFKNTVLKGISSPVVRHLRYWDKIAAQRPDVLIAVSGCVQQRIKKYYDRDSTIIYPPVELAKFRETKERIKKEAFYLVVSRLVPYKKVDLAIKAFNKLKLPLVIVGHGSEEFKLKKMAGANIRFIKELTDEELCNYYKKAQALIFPQEEDFGKVVVEAHAAGTPVVAFKAGGALDTVEEGVNGVFFDKQNIDSLVGAIKRISKEKFDPEEISKTASKFSKEVFRKKLSELINSYG